MMEFVLTRRHAVRVVVVLATAALSCTAGGDLQGERNAARSEPQPEAPPKVRPGRVASILSPPRLRRCMPKERVDIASLSGRYYGPVDFATDQVETVRKLNFSAPGDVAFVPNGEFERLLDPPGSATLDRNERAAERWLNWSFGFWSIGEDGRGGPSSSFVELVDGFYDPDQKNIVVRQEGELDTEYVVLAHELAHAAVDQAFGIPTRRGPGLLDDRTLTRRALVEGDATLTEMQVTARLSRTNKAINKTIQALITNDKIKQQERYEGMPHALIERFAFPYRWGLAFVCSVYNQRGWRGVNRMYSRPPTSSAEIMFPARYLFRHRPSKPGGFPKLPKPWKVYEEGTLGASHLKAMFEAPADQPQVTLGRSLARAAAWDGGRYRLWGRNPGSRDSVLGVSLVEHQDHVGVLCSSLMEWHELTFLTDKKVIADGVVSYVEPDRTTILACKGRHIRMAMAPNTELAAKVASL